MNRLVLRIAVVFAIVVTAGVAGWHLLQRTKVGITSGPGAPGAVSVTQTQTSQPGRSTVQAEVPDGSEIRTNALFQTAAELWQKPIAEEAFARFHDWAEKYAKSTQAEKAALGNEGIELATARRAALKQLIQTDPQRALELAVPLAVREQMPESIVDRLEERVSGRGRLAVLAALAEVGREAEVVPTFRRANLDGREFEAFVYGRRLGEPTRYNVPIHGLAVDNLLAVNETPLRILEGREAAKAKADASDPLCEVSGVSSTVVNQQVVAELAGQPVFLCRPSHAMELNDRLTAEETGGPTPSEEEPEASAWTEGQKSLILMRVDFPDLPGQPLADATAITLISNLNVFYTQMSYGRTGFYTNGAGSDFTPTFRMPQPAAWYGTNNYYDQLRAKRGGRGRVCDGQLQPRCHLHWVGARLGLVRLGLCGSCRLLVEE
jgi:hypothetical protein